MILPAYASPIPGSSFRSFSLAVLISRSALAAGADFDPGFEGAFFCGGAAARANATIRIQTYFANLIALSLHKVAEAAFTAAARGHTAPAPRDSPATAERDCP